VGAGAAGARLGRAALDGSYFHNVKPGWGEHWRGGEAVGLWEVEDTAARGAAADGGLQGEAAAAGPDGGAAQRRLVAVAHPEGAGEAWLEVHPDCRQLEDAMLEWAEANLAAPDRRKPQEPGARAGIVVYCGERDAPREELLRRRGYAKTNGGEVLRRWSGETPPEPVRLPAGYELRTVRPGHPGDCERYAALLNAAFRRTIHSAQEVATFTTLSRHTTRSLSSSRSRPT